MKHIVCYSGGEASAMVAIKVARCFGSQDVILLNHDINSWVEDADIKRFKREVANYLNLPITQANMPGWDAKDQLDVCVEARAFKVGSGHPFCTSRLKTEPFHRWLVEYVPVDPQSCRTDVTIYYGFEQKERQRIDRRRKHLGQMGYRTAFPLAEWDRTIQSTREIGIEPPSSYAIWKHANCTGCLRAGQHHWYVVYCLRPDVFEKAKWAEAQIGYTILKAGFLKDLEPKFERMKKCGIPAHEKISSASFWSQVKRALKDGEGKEEPEQMCLF